MAGVRVKLITSNITSPDRDQHRDLSVGSVLNPDLDLAQDLVPDPDRSISIQDLDRDQILTDDVAAVIARDLALRREYELKLTPALGPELFLDRDLGLVSDQDPLTVTKAVLLELGLEVQEDEIHGLVPQNAEDDRGQTTEVPDTVTIVIAHINVAIETVRSRRTDTRIESSPSINYKGCINTLILVLQKKTYIKIVNMFYLLTS